MFTQNARRTEIFTQFLRQSGWGILSCMRGAQKGRECVPLYNDVNIGQWAVAFSCSQKIPAVAKKKGQNTIAIRGIVCIASGEYLIFEFETHKNIRFQFSSRPSELGQIYVERYDSCEI